MPENKISSITTIKLQEALIDLKTALRVVHSMNDYTDSDLLVLAVNAGQAARLLPNLIQDGAFTSDEAKENLVGLLSQGAEAVRGQDFPFLGLEIDRLVGLLESDRV